MTPANSDRDLEDYDLAMEIIEATYGIAPAVKVQAMKLVLCDLLESLDPQIRMNAWAYLRDAGQDTLLAKCDNERKI